MQQNKVNCLKCIHYHVTWDPKFPNGCRAMNFKTKGMPSVTVLKNTGHDCLLFSPKSKSQKAGNRNGGFSEQA